MIQKTNAHGKKDDANKFRNQGEIALIDDLRNVEFENQQDFEARLLSRINGLNDRSDFYKWKITDKYVVVKCKYCHNFQIWYTY